MKKRIFYIIYSILILMLVASCVEDGYDFDSINKEGAFSHENGMYIQIGNFDTIRFQNSDVALSYIQNITGLFSESIYEYLVYDNKGRDEALGSISFEADFIVHINDASAKGFSDFELSAEILKGDGENTGIQIESTNYKADTSNSQAFKIGISKDDVPKLKEAYTLKLVFNFEAKKVDDDDYVLIHNVKLKALGGISFNLD